jgi:hypothetical protein
MKQVFGWLTVLLVFSISSAVVSAQESGQSPSSSFDDPTEASAVDGPSYYPHIAGQIANSIQDAMAHLSSSGEADLALLNSRSDIEVEKAQEKSPNSSISEDQQSAEERLAQAFENEFKQPDGIDYPGFQSGIPFEGSRDVFTFCPTGSEVKRPLTTTASIDGSKSPTEYVWGWSHCSATSDWKSQTAPSAVRVQQIWVYNLELKHPMLTLLMSEDDQPGKVIRLEIDINELAAGKVSAKDILKAISPTK